MIFCKDCVYYIKYSNLCDYDSHVLFYDPVTGKPTITGYVSCNKRNNKLNCGHYKKKWWKLWV
jgi:hypothetical protein